MASWFSPASAARVVALALVVLPAAACQDARDLLEDLIRHHHHGGGGNGGEDVLPPPPMDIAPGALCAPENWCWYNPRPSTDLWTSAVGTSERDLWIGGSARSLLHYDGRAWTLVPHALGEVERLFAFAPDNVWAVSVFGLSHWDGHAFTAVAGMPGGSDLWGSAPDDFYMIGSEVWHFDGTSWSTVPGVAAQRISGTARDDVWVGDYGGVTHFDGSAWTRVPAMEGRYIVDLTVPARGQIWATVFNPAGGYDIYRSDGVTWELVRHLDGVFVWTMTSGGPDDVWVTGDRAFTDPLNLHWDGQAFTEETGTTPLFTVDRVGDAHYGIGRGGRIFRRAPAPAGAPAAWRELSGGFVVNLHGVWGSAPDDMWAVGDGGTVLHYDGHAVTRIPTGVTGALRDVWGTSRADAWAVGAGGLALHWDGATWTPVTTGTTADLLAVFTATPGEAWMSGTGGTLLHAQAAGSTVSAVAVAGLPEGTSLIDMHGVSAADIWAEGGSLAPGFGNRLLVTHFDGSAWSPVQTLPTFVGTATAQNRIWAVASNDVWIRLGLYFRGDSEFWHWDGSAWSQRLMPETAPEVWMFASPLPFYTHGNPAEGTFAFSRDDLWTVGEYGNWLRRHPAP